MRSLTLCTVTPSMSSTACTSRPLWSESVALQVTSSTSRSCFESATSIAVVMPPASAMVVATLPTTAKSGSACRRMVIEYDDGVTLMLST